MNPEEVLAHLQKADGLENVPVEQLNWMISKSKIKVFEEGDFLFRGEDPADNLYVILSGLFRIYLPQGKGQREVADLEPGDITGILPYSRMVKATASGEAKQRSEVL